MFENKKPDLYKVNKHQITLKRDNDRKRVEADGIRMLVSRYLA